MKRIISLILMLVMLLSLAACGISESQSEPSTMGQRLYKEFCNLVEDGSKEPQALAEALLQSDTILFEGASMAVEPGFLMGFSTDIEGFEQAVMFGPMIGAIPFVGYVFQLEEGADSEKFCAELLEKADPRWNICTEADETLCGSAEDLVFFVMCSNEEAE